MQLQSLAAQVTEVQAINAKLSKDNKRLTEQLAVEAETNKVLAQKLEALTNKPTGRAVESRKVQSARDVLTDIGVYNLMPEHLQAVVENMEVFGTAKGFMMYVPKEEYLRMDSETKKKVIEMYTRLNKWLAATGKGQQVGKWFATADGHSYTGFHAEVIR